MCHLYGGRVVQATDAFLHAVRVVDPVHPLEKGLCRETSRSMDVDPTAVDEDSRLVLAHREIMLKQVSKWTDSRGELGPSGGTSIAEERCGYAYAQFSPPILHPLSSSLRTHTLTCMIAPTCIIISSNGEKALKTIMLSIKLKKG